MIGKILHGTSFGGLIDYINDPRKDARLVAYSDGVNLANNQTIADSFIMNAQLSLRATKPVGHFILSLSPRDADRITDKMLEEIAREYLKRMGYDDNQFVAFLHQDKKHPHIHIMVNRVNNQGRCTKDSHEWTRNVNVCKELTREFGLYMARGKDAVKEQRLRNMDAVRYHMMHCVSESLRVANNWKEFQDDLAKVGIRCRFRFNTSKYAVEGISFSIAKECMNGRMKHDVSFCGKQLDPSLTLAHLCEKLGNPVAIVHEQARDMYEDARQDWLDAHTYREAQYVDSYFPDFDTKFHWQAEERMKTAPDMAGTMNDFSSSLLHDLQESSEDICDAGNNAMQVGLHALGVILFDPYAPTMSSCGSGGSSSKLGWGDDDKYKKKKRNNVRSPGLHR